MPPAPQAGDPVAPVRLPAAIRDAVVAHALAERPNEACGVVVGDRPAAAGGRPIRFVATRNALASPYRFEVHPDDLLRLVLEADRAGEAFWAIVHSHVGSAPVPSPTDVARAAYPEALHLVVSLARRPPGRAVPPDPGGLSGPAAGAAGDGVGPGDDTGPAEVDHADVDLALWRIADGLATPVPLEVGA